MSKNPVLLPKRSIRARHLATRNRILQSLRQAGLPTLDTHSYVQHVFNHGPDRLFFLCLDDADDYIEFGLSRYSDGHWQTLVYAVLLWGNGDLWVSSQTRADLNGQVKLEQDGSGLFDRALGFLRSFGFARERSAYSYWRTE